MKEEWREFGPNNCYRVSNFGSVQTRLLGGGKYKNNAIGDSWRNLSQSKGKTDNHGGYYLSVSSKDNQGKSKHRRVHRIVAENFISNPNNFKEVNHIDGNGENNKVDNLEWCDRKHNAKNAKDRGVFKGLTSFSGRFNAESPLTVLTLNMAGFNHPQIAKMYKCDQSQISRMLSCKRQNPSFPSSLVRELRRSRGE